MPSTILSFGDKRVTLKYTRKMPRGEVERMKSFMTKNGAKLIKTARFKIISQSDLGAARTFRIVL